MCQLCAEFQRAAQAIRKERSADCRSVAEFEGRADSANSVRKMCAPCETEGLGIARAHMRLLPRQGRVFSFTQALPCRRHPGGPTSPAPDALAGAGSTCGRFSECLMASRVAASLESASFANDGVCQKPQSGVHLAADYGPKRSNSDGLAGSCLTISRVMIQHHPQENAALRAPC